MGPVTLETAGVAAGSYANVQSSGAYASSASSAYSGGGGEGMIATATEVRTGADTFVQSTGQGNVSDQQLRMVLALMILQALLGKDQDESTSRMTELAGLAATLDFLGHQGDAPTFSATNIIQIQNQSTLVYSAQAVQTTTEPAVSGDAPPGSRLDVTA